MRFIKFFPVASPLTALHAAGVALLLATALNGQTLTISPSTLPSATAGTTYSPVLLTVAGGTPPYTWGVSGSLPSGMSGVQSGTSSVNFIISGTPATAGRYSFTITVRDSSNVPQTGSNNFTLVVGGAGSGGSGLAVTTTTLTTAAVGQSYSQTLAASGGTSPYTWSVGQGFPPGLTLASTGAISGTPTTAGTYSFTVQATDAASATATANLSITVNPAALQITTVGPLFNGTAGAAYTSVTLAAQGGKTPYTWSILSGNTDGLTLSSAGTLSGTPASAGTFIFVVQVADSSTPAATASQSFSITVNAPSLVITAISFPAGTVGVPYNQTSPVAVASGGTAPYTWSLLSGSVPGLTFVPASVSLTGTPTTPGASPSNCRSAIPPASPPQNPSR